MIWEIITLSVLLSIVIGFVIGYFKVIAFWIFIIIMAALGFLLGAGIHVFNIFIT